MIRLEPRLVYMWSIHDQLIDNDILIIGSVSP